MGRWFPVRQNARISTRLEALIETGEGRHVVTLLSLSEGGFYCEGFDLHEIGPEFRVRFSLEATSPAWSPTPGAAGWRSRMGAGEPNVQLEVEAELLYLDLGERQSGGETKVGLGARFSGLDEAQLDELQDFIARETFRATEWRTAGGAVPAARHLATGPDRSH